MSKTIVFKTIVFGIIGLVLASFLTIVIWHLEPQIKKDYRNATVIQSEEELNTLDAGPTFLYGTLRTESPVTMPNVDGEYVYIVKMRENYRYAPFNYALNPESESWHGMYQWIEVDSQVKVAPYCMMYDLKFPVDNDVFRYVNSTERLKIVQISDTERDVYYGVPVNTKGTLFVNMSKDMTPNVSFFDMDITPDEFLDEQWVYAIPCAVACIWFLYVMAIIYCYLRQRADKGMVQKKSNEEALPGTIEERKEIRDNLFYQIDPEIFCKYLQDTGWQQSPIKIFQIDCGDEFYQAIVPLNQTVEDYRKQIKRAVEEVASYEGKTLDEVLSSLRDMSIRNRNGGLR